MGPRSPGSGLLGWATATLPWQQCAGARKGQQLDHRSCEEEEEADGLPNKQNGCPAAQPPEPGVPGQHRPAALRGEAGSGPHRGQLLPELHALQLRAPFAHPGQDGRPQVHPGRAVLDGHASPDAGGGSGSRGRPRSPADAGSGRGSGSSTGGPGDGRGSSRRNGPTAPRFLRGCRGTRWGTAAAGHALRPLLRRAAGLHVGARPQPPAARLRQGRGAAAQAEAAHAQEPRLRPVVPLQEGAAAPRPGGREVPAGAATGVPSRRGGEGGSRKGHLQGPLPEASGGRRRRGTLWRGGRASDTSAHLDGTFLPMSSSLPGAMDCGWRVGARELGGLLSCPTNMATGGRYGPRGCPPLTLH